MPKSDFVILQEIGKGSFAMVYKCKRKTDNKIYAIKQVKIDRLKSKQRINALNQIRLLASITNPFIVSYKQAFYDQQSSSLCIVMQFANEGDLQIKIKQHIQEKTKFKQMEIWKTAYHLLKALKILHSSKIIHRDIKSANIYFNDGIAKLGDMNISKILKTNFTNTQTGTPFYASPQVWNDEPYGSKSDMWSLGIVLYEMSMLALPFKGIDFEHLYKKIKSGIYQKLSINYSRCLNEFISKLLQVDQKKRLSAQQALQNSMFIDFELKEKQQEQCEIQLLDTIQMPKMNKNLNERLPGPKYDMDQRKSKNSKKLKTVIFDEETLKKPESSNKIPSINHIKSENKLYPISSKLLPCLNSQKDLGNVQLKKVRSNKILNMNKIPLKILNSLNDLNI